MTILRRYLLLLYFATVVMQKASSQDVPYFPFRTLTTEQGLSNNVAMSVTEDKSGFIWIGTANGLNRYDGYRMKTYFHDETDSNSLGNNLIYELLSDRQGRIWAVTNDGVSCFLPSENRFINYSTSQKKQFRLLINYSTKIYEDVNGVIWITTQTPVVYKVLPDFSLEEITTSMKGKNTAPSVFSGYTFLIRDTKNNEWGYNQSTIYQVDKDTKDCTGAYDFRKELGIAGITNMYAEENNKIIFTTWGAGSWIFDITTKQIKPVGCIPTSIYKTSARWRYNNNDWHLFLGNTEGVFITKDLSKKATKILPVSNQYITAGGQTYSSLYTDRRGNLWVCSDRGVSYLLSSNVVFDIRPVIPKQVMNDNTDKSSIIYAYAETGSLRWYTKQYKITFAYDSSQNSVTEYRSLYPPSNTRYNWMSHAYYFLQQGNTLFITTDSGLIEYSFIKKAFLKCYNKEKNKALPLRNMIQLNDSQLLIRSRYDGLFIFNTVKKEFTANYSGSDSCKQCLPQSLNYLFKTRTGDIYLTAKFKNNFIKLSQPGLGITVLKPKDSQGRTLSPYSLYGIDESKDGHLWLATSDGISEYDPSRNNIASHYNENGQMGVMFRICVDNDDNVWANGSSGIWCFIRNRKKWISFSNKDGLPGSDFNGALSLAGNGNIIAGLENAVAVFHPSYLGEQQKNLSAIITEASIGKRTIPFSLSGDSKKHITLLPGINSFSADFAIPASYSISAVKYYYKLEPLDKEFRQNNNGHINFNGLAPGKYTLLVRGGDNMGTVYTFSDTLEITVKPRWYQSFEFKITAFLLFALLASLFIRRRILTIRKEATLKQKIAETEMQSLRTQMNPHFIFNSLNSIENFIMENEKRLASDYLNKFAQLIRMILDSSREETVPLSADMKAMQLYVELEQLRFNNSFSYKTEIEPALFDYPVPSLIAQPFLENAIVHGFAHSTKKDLQLSVSVILKKGQIHYTIEDNGIGRNKAAEYKQRNKPRHKSVGLEITRNRISIYNKGNSKENPLVITDLYDTNNNPCGTKVEIFLNTN